MCVHSKLSFPRNDECRYQHNADQPASPAKNETKHAKEELNLCSTNVPHTFSYRIHNKLK